MVICRRPLFPLMVSWTSVVNTAAHYISGANKPAEMPTSTDVLNLPDVATMASSVISLVFNP